MEKTLNKKYLRNYSYKDDSALKARKRLYLYANPKVDLENEIFKLINLKKVNRILDVGCGNGDLLIRLRKETGFKGELFGIDISKGILEPGIKQNMAEGLNIQFKVSYAEDLHFEDNYFDVIISKHVLFHLPQFQRAVDEAYRCLKPGGSFIIVLNSKKISLSFWNLKGLFMENTVFL